MVHDGYNCSFSFWAIFCPFTPTNSLKNQNFNKMKKHLGISLFYTSVWKIIIIICYTVLEMWHVTDLVAIFHFELFFALLPSS